MSEQERDLEWLLSRPVMKIILSGAVPVVILLLIYAKFKLYPYDNMTVLSSDLNGQYVSYLGYLRSLFTEGGSFVYSFSKTMGGDITGLITYYLMSPFNLLVLFFSAEELPRAVLCILLAKTATAGITMYLYLSEEEYTYRSLLFSTAYALSGYMLMFQTHIMWLDGVYCLPLVALGIRRLLKKKKAALYMISLAFSIITCYYIGYMLCIFSVLYYVYELALSKQRGKEKLASLPRFGFASLFAGGMSAAALFLALSSLLGSRIHTVGIKTEASLEELGAVAQWKGLLTIKFYPWDLLSKFFTGAGNDFEFEQGIPFVFCGILSFALFLASFLSRSVRLREKIANLLMTAFFVICFSVLEFDRVWHGFALPHYFYHRYAFVFIFFVLVIARKEMETLIGGEKGALVTTLAAALLVTLAALFVSYGDYSYIRLPLLLLDILFAIAGLLLLYFYPKTDKDFRGILLLLVFGIQMADLSINGIVSLEDRGYQDTSLTGYVREVEDSIDYVKKYDTSLYRLEQDFHYSQNDAMLFSYRGLSHFSSTESEAIIAFLGKLGYVQNYTYWAKYGEGATLAADSLLGVKYLLSRKDLAYLEPFYTDDTVNTYYNPYSLPFGFLCREEILQTELTEAVFGPFENQNRIYQALTGEPERILKPIEADWQAKGMNWNADEHCYEVAEGADESYLSLSFTAKNEFPVYLYLHATKTGGATLFINGVEKGRCLSGATAGVLNLGTFQKGEEIKLVLYPMCESIGFDASYLAYLDVPLFTELTKTLQAGGWYQYEGKDTAIQAEISAKEDGMLFLSIPYDKNWKVTVDGVVTEPERVLEVLIAVPVTAGTHQISLRYQNQVIILGALVTLVCTFAAIALIIIENRKHKTKRQKGQLLKAA